MRLQTTLAAVLAVVPGLASAQGFAGAEVSAEILAFTEDADLGETRYAGGVEFDAFGPLAVGVNLAFHGYRGFDADGRNLTLHGSYGFGRETAAGLFYAADSIDGDADDLGAGDADLYGVEAATTFRGVAVEAALGRFDTDDTLFSAEASYAFGSLRATGSAGFVRGDADASRLALGGAYRLNAGPEVFAEVGRVEVAAEDGLEDASETYLSIGARVSMGPNAGTTFGNRGIFEVIPGF